MTNGSDAFNKKYILNNSGRNFLPSFKERRKRFNLSSNSKACWNELEKAGETLETLISMQNLVGTFKPSQDSEVYNPKYCIEDMSSGELRLEVNISAFNTIWLIKFIRLHLNILRFNQAVMDSLH